MCKANQSESIGINVIIASSYYQQINETHMLSAHEWHLFSNSAPSNEMERLAQQALENVEKSIEEQEQNQLVEQTKAPAASKGSLCNIIHRT